MNGDVYILGAGASFESGAPLMNRLMVCLGSVNSKSKVLKNKKR